MTDAPIPVRADFLTDLRNLLANSLKIKGFPADPTDDVDKLLVQHINIENRHIQPRQRSVVWSTELGARRNDLTAAQGEALQKIEEVSTSGGDLTPYLSRKVVGAKKKADFNDKLLCEWDTHHLHLGDGLDTDGKVKGTKEVLFAVARKDRLYFIEVLEHAFTDQRIFDIIASNWPDLVQVHRISACGSAAPVSNEERGLLRHAGVNTLTAGSDGNVYGPLGRGIATDGSSSRVRSEADRLRDAVEDLEAKCRGSAQDIAEKVSAMTGRQVEALDLKLIATEGGVLRVIETGSGIEVRQAE